MRFPFNVRVYGLLINDKQEVLVTDEWIKEKVISKFPGGGLEYGEGTTNCLIRECKEELNVDVEILKHFYTTDFFVESAFRKGDQVISIYYLMKVVSGEMQILKNTENEILSTDIHALRWIKIDENLSKELTLVIDKKVAELLREDYSV